MERRPRRGREEGSRPNDPLRTKRSARRAPWGRPSGARGPAELGDCGGPAEASLGRVEERVRRGVQVPLQRGPDHAPRQESPESDRAANRGELGPAVAAGDAGAVELLGLLEPPHRDGAVRRAVRVRLPLDQRLAIRIEDGYRVIWSKGRIRAWNDEAGSDRRLDQDATLNATTAPAGPRVGVE